MQISNHLNYRQIQSHWLRNMLHTLLLLGGVGLLFGLTGYLLLGGSGLLFGLGVILATTLFVPQIPPHRILRWMGAHPLKEWEAPQLYRIIDTLAERAQLPTAPVLYLLPERRPNAFAMGHKEAPYLGITQGLLQQLTPAEMEGVLAHEIAHIQHNDLRVLGIAEQLARITSLLSTFGLLALVLLFPALLLTGQTISWMLLPTLLLGPPATRLLLLALSRIREFEADRQAAVLTGNPRGLLAALTKLEASQRPWWQQIFFPKPTVQEPSALRTHPLLQERIQRLRSMQQAQDSQQPVAPTRLPRSVRPPITRRIYAPLTPRRPYF